MRSAGPVRADRLVATLLFLQSRGRATVAEVALELEVSPARLAGTLEALALAGVPVDSQAEGRRLVPGRRSAHTRPAAGPSTPPRPGPFSSWRALALPPPRSKQP